MIFWIREVVMNTFAFFLKVLALIIPKQKKLILFGAHNGTRFSDNPAVLFKYILNTHKELQPVWLTNSDQVIDQVKKIGGKVYKRRSSKGIWLSLRTSLYISSHNIKDVLMYIPLQKKPKHIYLHHGIPLRKGWLNIKDAPKKSIQSTYNKINASNYMIAPSAFAAEQQNKLLPIGVEHFVFTGLPRNDVFFDKNFDKDDLKTQFGLSGFDKVVLYGPTWRPWGATQFFPFEDYDLASLKRFLEEQNMCLVLRPHHVDLNNDTNADFWKSVETVKHIKLITHDICSDVNHLCMISDALITDYSSMYYDYLIQDKPVIFLVYDFEKYNTEIGFYPDFLNITHGHKPKDQASFLTSLLEVSEGKDSYRDKRNQLKNKFYDHLDGGASKRVTELILSMVHH